MSTRPPLFVFLIDPGFDALHLHRRQPRGQTSSPHRRRFRVPLPSSASEVRTCMPTGMHILSTCGGGRRWGSLRAMCMMHDVLHHASCIMHHVCINVAGVPRGQYIPGTGTFAACLPPQASMPTDRSSRAESTRDVIRSAVRYEILRASAAPLCPLLPPASSMCRLWLLPHPGSYPVYLLR